MPSPVTTTVCSPSTTTCFSRAGILPEIKTESMDSLAVTGKAILCVFKTGFRRTWARGMNRATSTSTDKTPTANVPTRTTGCKRHGASLTETCSRFARRSFRGAWRVNFFRRGVGQATRCACPVDSKIGMFRAAASSRTCRVRVTRPSCAPSANACLCRTFKSTCRRVTFSYLGHTSKIRGVFAQDILSRTEMRSS